MPIRTSNHQDGVRVVTIDDHATRNALTADALEQLRTALASAAADEAVRVLVLTAAGPYFCSGGDTGRMGTARPTPWEKRDYLKEGVGRVAAEFDRFDKPTVLALNGPAVGAGVDLALWCDFRIASPTAYLRLGFVDLGLTPGFGSAWLLTHMLGRSRALEILLLGEPISAEDALALGVVRSVSDDPLAAALDLAGRLAAKSGPSIRATKRLVQRAASVDVGDSLEQAWAFFGLLQETPEHTRAVGELRERRRRRGPRPVEPPKEEAP